MRDKDGVIRRAPKKSHSSLCTGPSCHRLRAGTPSLEDPTSGLGQSNPPSSVVTIHRQRKRSPALASLESNLTSLPLYERSGLMAPQPPNIKLENQQDEATNADDFSSDTHGEAGRHNGTREDQTLNEPLLFHKVKNQKSILAIVISESKIFAGTQGGEILVRLWAGWTFD